MLPPALRDALDHEIARVSASRVTTAARALIASYRATPDRPARPLDVDPEEWRAAYLEVRFSATFAALDFVAGELARLVDLQTVTSITDLGCGPGTALHAWAPHLPALDRAGLVDRDEGQLDVAERLARAMIAPGVAVVLEQRDIADTHRPAPADLIAMGYALGEVAPRDRPRTIERAWLDARQYLVIAEPGTSAGFTRILEARRLLVSRGAHILAPCGHERACGMQSPDWCHVDVRVERTRRMRQIKQAELGHEDEALAYLIAGRSAPDHCAPRIVARPAIDKGRVSLTLCAPEGLRVHHVTRRDEPWRAARKARWGATWTGGAGSSGPQDDRGGTG